MTFVKGEKSQYGGQRRPFKRDDDRAGSRDPGRRFEKKTFSKRTSEGKKFELFETVCAKCGKTCEVPFRPSGGKPVLCRDCFKSDAPRAAPGASSDKLDQINRKLDKIMRALKIE